MISPTFKVETPVTKTTIEIYEWITGRKAEYIQEPILSAVKLGGSPMAGGEMNISNIDAKTAIQDSAHREIESYVAKVGEENDPKKCLEVILDMPEEDYTFIQAEIGKLKAAGKKKLQA